MASACALKNELKVLKQQYGSAVVFFNCPKSFFKAKRFSEYRTDQSGNQRSSHNHHSDATAYPLSTFLSTCCGVLVVCTHSQMGMEELLAHVRTWFFASAGATLYTVQIGHLPRLSKIKRRTIQIWKDRACLPKWQRRCQPTRGLIEHPPCSTALGSYQRFPEWPWSKLTTPLRREVQTRTAVNFFKPPPGHDQKPSYETDSFNAALRLLNL